MGPARAPGQTQDGAPGIHIPIGSAQAREGGHHHHAAGGGDRGRQGIDLRGGAYDTQLVPQPLDGAAAVKNAALQGVAGLTFYLPGNGGDQARPAAHRVRPYIYQGKAAGAVCIFCLAGSKAPLAEEGRLLVPRRTAHRDPRHLFKAGNIGLHGAVDLTVGHRPGQDGHGNMQNVAQLLVPAEVMNIEEHGPGGIGVVRHMAAGELPDEVALHGAEEQLAPLRPIPGPGDIIQYPADFRGRKIGIQQEAGGGLDPLRKAPLFQLLAHLRRAAALPDNGVIHRLAGFFVPQQGGLPLVGDADAQHLARLYGAQGLCRRPALRPPNVCRVVLHPAGLGIDLGKVVLAHRGDLTAAVKQNGAGAGGSLVQRQNILLHWLLLFSFSHRCDIILR